MSAGAEGERFFIAAFADDKGASLLANRIREQFARLPRLKQTGVTLSVSYSMLPPLLRDAGASTEVIVTSMAARLKESVKFHITPRGSIMSNKKILIVEDDADVRLVYQFLLTAHHYDTLFAADSISAVSEALKHRPDLILLDLGLPAGGGFIVLKRLQANMNLALIPVIVVSGRDSRDNQEPALKAGAKAFVQKPWNENELLAIIRQLLGQPDPSVS
jgi:CheY-like chemotaxis protein